MTVFVFLVGCFASMIFGACVMFTIMDIYLLEKKVDRLKRRLKKLKSSEPEKEKVIDNVPEKEE